MNIYGNKSGKEAYNGFSSEFLGGFNSLAVYEDDHFVLCVYENEDGINVLIPKSDDKGCDEPHG